MARHPTTWNPYDIVGGGLSANFLTLTATGAGGVRCVGNRDERRHYWEVTLTTISANTGIGVCNNSVNLASPGTTAVNACCVFKNGDVYLNGAATGVNIGALVSGNVVCIALDLSSNNHVWFRKGSGLWNGSAGANPDTDSGGISVAGIVGSVAPTLGLYACYFHAASGEQCTANFGASAFAFTTPVNYTNLEMHGSIWSVTDLVAMTLSTDTYQPRDATSTAVTAWVRAYLGRTTGKYYWEVKMVTWANANTGIGITNSLVTPAEWNSTGTLQLLNNGQIYRDGVSVANTLTGAATGANIGIALDCDNRKCWMRVCPSGQWNGNLNGDPAAGTGGIDVSSIGGLAISLYPLFQANAVNDKATAYFDGSPDLIGAVPTGFIDGFPGGVVGITSLSALVTQAAVEEWLAPVPVDQVTQVALEMWASTATVNGQAWVTQVALEMWAKVTPPGRTKVWDGSAWVLKPVKVWSGSAWVTKPLKVWDGSVWK